MIFHRLIAGLSATERGVNCGAFVLAIAEALITSQPIPDEIFRGTVDKYGRRYREGPGTWRFRRGVGDYTPRFYPPGGIAAMSCKRAMISRFTQTDGTETVEVASDAPGANDKCLNIGNLKQMSKLPTLEQHSSR